MIYLTPVRLAQPLILGCVMFLSTCHAQVVQLPIVRNFSYSGGAVVPDSGTGYLAGNSYGATSSVGRGGIPGNRAVGGIGGVNQMSATVQIIDLDALDQAILNSNVPSAAIREGSRVLPVSDAAAADKARKFLSTYQSARTARSGDPSYREVKSALGNSTPKEPVDASLAESNVRYFLKQGQEAEAASRIQSARVYYRMAIESMTPELMERYQKVLSDREKAEKEKKSKEKDGRKQF